MSLPFTMLDYIAVAWFLGIWSGYARFAAWRARHGHPSLMSTMGSYRREWWAAMLDRDFRIVDVSILTTLSNSATFFASTTLLILGGLLALLGSADRVIPVMAELPFGAGAQGAMWEYKVLLLVGIFIYAFFKFTWSLRQHNFCSVLVGAAPKEETDAEKREAFVTRSARIASSASDNFNYGLRAYYFGLAALSWFMNPWIFMFITTWVVFILYYREFRSKALEVLLR